MNQFMSRIHAATGAMALGLAAAEPGLTSDERRWGREARSGWLRLTVLVILIANLLAGEHDGNLLVHGNVVIGYTLATVLALGLALNRRGPYWGGTAFVIVDAVFVIALFHEHLIGPSGSFDHALTAPSLAIAFMLLSHVALRLNPRLVVVFAAIVLTGWLALFAVTALPQGLGKLLGSLTALDFLAEAALAAAFVFAAFVSFLLTQDHNVLLEETIMQERRRQNLSRFFSPLVVSALQAEDVSMDLKRRDAAVMFVDLRAFTRFTETAELDALAELLAEYRQQVTGAVFDWGGTVDKFIGDGVMAVFGQPSPSPDDADRALRCALQLNDVLTQWSRRRQRDGEVALDAGIGLHFGPVIGGVLESGCHNEFTVFGDTVNVAERLERLTKSLGASVVVSASLLAKVRSSDELAPWIWKDAVELDGRSATLRVAYLRATPPNDSAARKAACENECSSQNLATTPRRIP